MFCSAMSEAAISLSSVDDFSSTSEGWFIGGAGVQPARNAGNGEDGNPGFLSHFSDGGGSQGKWLMLNTQSDWTGNYGGAGVSAITFAAEVTAGSNLGIRIGFDGPGGWFYSAVQTVDAGWNQYTFNLTAGLFTYATGSGGSANFADTMSNVTRFEIFGGPGSVTWRSGGDLLQAGNSTATLSIDSIQAVPEPASLALVLLGLMAFRLARIARV